MALSVAHSKMRAAAGVGEQEIIRNAIFVVCVALLVPLAADSIQLFGTQVLKLHSLQMLLLNQGEWLFAPLIAMVFVAAAPLRWRGLPIAVAALGVSYAMFINFRGSWIWTGFFDRYEQSAGAWSLAAMCGVILGVIGHAAICLRGGEEKAVPNRYVLRGIIAIGIASLWTFLEPRSFAPIDSAFPPTRFIAYSFAALILAGAYLWSLRD